MNRNAVAFLLLFLGVSACSMPGEEMVRERPIEETGNAYQLNTGDKLRVTVFGQADLSGDFTVDAGGNVSLPMIQPVPARGRTAAELQTALAAELGRTLLRNPNVSIQIMEFRPFFILGEVQRAGQYPYVNGMTVQSAVAIAGGFTYRANDDIVRITRKQGESLLEMDVKISTLVQPGDTILVKERYF
jgi:protein involved in polysaccharide export with SLBB domain